MTSSDILFNEYIEIKEKLDSTKLIVLYGNSVIACILKIALKELGILSDCAVFDKGNFLNCNLEDNKRKGKIIILCSSRKSTRESMKADANIFFPDEQIFDFYAIYFMWIKQIIKRNCDYNILAETLLMCREDNCLFNIDSINTFSCNLRCKECSNGIQHRRIKRKINIDLQIKFLKKLTSFLPVSQCNFQGGEVFTDISFSNFIKNHASNPKIAIFTIATNGTILPGDEIFKAIKETGALIRISDYGVLSNNKQAIEEKCSEYNIPCFTFPMAEQWRKFGDYYQRNRSESELQRISRECCFGTHDMMFVEDKLFCCLRTLYADALGDTNDAINANTLDLNSDFSTEELKRFIHGDNLWKMCDYCDSPMDIIPPAEQI